jgi:hypothetical protein
MVINSKAVQPLRDSTKDHMRLISSVPSLEVVGFGDEVRKNHMKARGLYYLACGFCGQCVYCYRLSQNNDILIFSAFHFMWELFWITRSRLCMFSLRSRCSKVLVRSVGRNYVEIYLCLIDCLTPARASRAEI